MRFGQSQLGQLSILRRSTWIIVKGIILGYYKDFGAAVKISTRRTHHNLAAVVINYATEFNALNKLPWASSGVKKGYIKGGV